MILKVNISYIFRNVFTLLVIIGFLELWLLFNRYIEYLFLSRKTFLNTK